MEIKIIGRIAKNKNLYFCDYSPLLLPAIKNWAPLNNGCVKVMKGKCFIKSVSLGFFTEILAKNNVPFTVITTLN